jgi:ribosomal protein L34
VKKNNWTPDDIIAQYGDFNDTAMGEAEEEARAEDTLTEDDALGDVIRDAQRDCESEKEKAKFDRMLEDHQKLLYPSTEERQKKLGYNTRVATMKGTEWCIRQVIWAITENPKKCFRSLTNCLPVHTKQNRSSTL